MTTSQKGSVSEPVPFNTFKDDLEVNGEVANLINDTRTIQTSEN